METDDGVTRNLTFGTSGHWVKYNGTNNSVLDSYNQSSLTDIAAGRHRSNIRTDYNNANFSAQVSNTQNNNHGIGWGGKPHLPAVGSISIATGMDGSTNASAADNQKVWCTTHGEQ